MLEAIGFVTVASVGTIATLAWVLSLEHECIECEYSVGRNPPNYCPECGNEEWEKVHGTFEENFREIVTGLREKTGKTLRIIGEKLE